MNSRFTGVYVGYAIGMALYLVIPQIGYWLAKMWADYQKIGGPPPLPDLSIPWYVTGVAVGCLALDITYMVWHWWSEEE